ncbi:hypothetical protein KFL_000680220 [Klebsormidium nitens]|uniref:Uncharacterized protein n=1 Tax=Klebsormidium nitens TaxID=105231 RepID=A0A0U9HKP4_KLENI|nr:hypothetical protein KFL_000680220 [Klebsormidium nitens]|eukprot:GAQ81005.1 hypothetical protein KFL_000680220 [Klebsormidium nitens]
MASRVLALFLTAAAAAPDKRFAVRRWLLLQRLERILSTLVLKDPQTKKEAKTWLVTSIAKLNPPAPSEIAAFLSFLPKPSRRGSSHSRITDAPEAFVLHQLALLLCENRITAPRLARLLSRDVDMKKRFFSRDDRRIEAWFSHFAAAVDGEHSFGSKALARYSLRYRDECWEELEWAGSHPQAPGMVATKPHYFSELDVVRTVRNFLKHVPDFWTSDDWRDCVSCGEFLALDPDFFAKTAIDFLVAKSRKGSPDDEVREEEYVRGKLLEILEDFLREESFPTLCQRLLHLASPEGLLSFLERLQESAPINRSRDPQLAAVTDVKWRSLDDALLCNACAANGRQVVRLLTDDEFLEQRTDLDALVSEASTSGEEAEFRSFRSELRNRSRATERKWLILESWLLRWRLSQVSEPEAMQRILEDNGVAFRTFVDVNRELLPESSGEEATRSNERKRTRRGRKRRKRKSGTHSSDSDSSEKSERNSHSESDVETRHRKERRPKSAEGGGEIERKGRGSTDGADGGTDGTDGTRTLAGADGVYLQTDGFSFRWSLSELPDHLAEHSLAVWLGWKDWEVTPAANPGPPRGS